ncbi:MAG: PadR family transcriptional regulator [Anaerolineaceae bacterium]|nr:PadR family transcriptional regulator [Anaerolineaceae bacterium]
MSLKHTILGFLHNSPKTGYDLQRKVEKTIQHFWPSTQSQIYRTLKDLEQMGMISSSVEIQSAKPNKKIYTITEDGVDELQQWLSNPIPVQTHRNQSLVQIFFSSGVAAEKIVTNLEHYKQELTTRLRFLHSDEVSASIQLGKEGKEQLLYELIVENGIRLLTCEIDWANDAIKKIKHLNKE